MFLIAAGRSSKPTPISSPGKGKASPSSPRKPKLNSTRAEPLSNASDARLECLACNLFRDCSAPFMRPFVPRGWTGKLLLILEAPGEDEKPGRPLTGRAGKLMRRLWHAAGYQDAYVAIANAVRCGPPDNET